jgi:glycosyltransferase involved in cell wall biosynthesis
MENIVELIVPCFNEETSLPYFFQKYQELKKYDKKNIYRLLIVDNASTDKTFQKAVDFAKKDSSTSVIQLARNFGKEASLSAGLNNSIGDLVIPIDADLQDPLEIVPELVKKYYESSADVILGKRKNRKNDLKSRSFYSFIYSRLFSKISTVKLENNVGEFRLMNRKVINAFNTLPESERFVRGMFAYLGFQSDVVEYSRPARSSGKSNFTFLKLLNLGIDGFVSFSTKPLRFATYLGFIGSLLSMSYGIAIVLLQLQGKIKVSGYTSILASILILGSLQLLTIGILGEYVGKTLMEAKRRPAYVISQKWPIN